MFTADRLFMPLGDALFSLRAMRTLKPEPIAGTITTLHPDVETRVHALCSIPATAQVVYCIPLGYPRGNFGPNVRKPVAEGCSYNGWGTAPLWA